MASGAPHRTELGLTDGEYELIVEKLGREPNEVELAVFSLMWSEHCGYKHSRRLLMSLPTEGPRLVLGPGENAGAGQPGGRAGVRVQGRVAQPPQRGRAVPGGGHGRRRHPARRVRDRRAADRDPRLAALRRAGRLAPLPLPARACGRGHRALRQLDRRRDGRRGDLLRGAVRAELPGQRDVRRPDRDRQADPVGGRRGSATWSCCSAPARGGTGSAARRCSPPPSWATRTRPSARPSRSATRSRRAACSSARSSCSTASCSSRSRTSAPRA